MLVNTLNIQLLGKVMGFANSQQVATVQRFVSGTQMVGRGVLVLDFAMRTEKVYHAEDSWREGVVQYSGFGASAGTGALVAMGTKAIGIALVLSPVGWIVLIGAAVLVGFVAASKADSWMQNEAASRYDNRRDRR